MGEEGGKIFSFPTYEWHYNETSITRRGNNDYEYGICTPGYIYNLHHAYDVAQREGVSLKAIAPSALETAFSCFIYYNVALAKEIPQESLEAIEELSRKFYYEYYNQIFFQAVNCDIYYAVADFDGTGVDDANYVYDEVLAELRH